MQIMKEDLKKPLLSEDDEKGDAEDVERQELVRSASSSGSENLDGVLEFEAGQKRLIKVDVAKYTHSFLFVVEDYMLSIRVVILLYITVVFVLDLVYNWKGGFIFGRIGTWGYLVMILYFYMIACMGLRLKYRSTLADSGLTAYIGPKAYKALRLTDILFECSMTNSLYVVLVYWVLTYPGVVQETPDPNFFDLNTHGINLVIMLFELFLSRMAPTTWFPYPDTLFVLGLGLLSVLFVFLWKVFAGYWLFSAINNSDIPLPAALIILTGSYLLYVACYTVMMGALRLRERIRAYLVNRKAVQVHILDTQTFS